MVACYIESCRYFRFNSLYIYIYGGLNITDTLLRIEISAFLKFIFVHTSAVVAYAVTSLTCKERFILYASCNHHLVTVIYELTLKAALYCLNTNIQC